MLEAGVIHPSQSLWCNAVVLVKKKDGTLHFCVNFRHLNMQTKKDSYPLPHIQEALESMVGSAHFSLMDFKSGFWQIKMALESQQYTAFTVGNLGFYEFTHMLFGLCNAPATFQHLMQNTFGCKVLLLLWLAIWWRFCLFVLSVLNFWGMFVRVYPKIVQGLTFLNSVKHITIILAHCTS